MYSHLFFDTCSSINGPTNSVTTTTPSPMFGSTFTSIPSVTNILPQNTEIKVMNFIELQALIDEWRIEMSALETDFHEQCQTYIFWNNTLWKNNDILDELEKSIEKLQKQERFIDGELNWIEYQQKNLEKELQSLPATNLKLEVNNRNRQIDYQNLLNINSHLEDIAELLDVKFDEIKAEQSEIFDRNCSFHQLMKILNCHFDALRHIEHSTSRITLPRPE